MYPGFETLPLILRTVCDSIIVLLIDFNIILWNIFTGHIKVQTALPDSRVRSRSPMCRLPCHGQELANEEGNFLSEVSPVS